MIFCSNCGRENDDAARVCLNCGASFGGREGSTPFTTAPPRAGEEQAGDVWTAPPAPHGGLQGVQTPPGGLFASGEKREPALVIVFSLVTCFIYLFYWWYVTGTEIKQALRREDINPTLDLLLGIITCGLYYIYLSYLYPQLLLQMQDRVRLPRNDITILSLVLYIVFAPVSIFMIQTELNKVWSVAEHTNPRPNQD